MKKNKWKLVIVFFIAIIVCIIAYFIRYFALLNSIIWEYKADYKTYSNEFNTVKDFLASEYGADASKCFHVDIDSEAGIKIYDFDEKIYLSLSNDVSDALTTLRKDAFPYGSELSVININGEMISFSSEGKRYALVYSPSQRPTVYFGHSKIKVKSIGDGWYHIAIRE